MNKLAIIVLSITVCFILLSFNITQNHNGEVITSVSQTTFKSKVAN